MSEDKLRRYLLSETHPVGREKARFLARLGYSAQHWPELRWALLEIARSSEVAATEATTHGTKYVVDGYLQKPGYGGARVRTIWFVETKGTLPRLVTVVPR